MRKAFLVTVLLLIIAAIWGAQAYFQVVRNERAPVNVNITKGMGTNDIARELEAIGVINSSLMFRAHVVIGGHQGALKAGEYRLPSNADYDTVITKLKQGSENPTVTITVPEGLSRIEVAERFSGSGYYPASARHPLINLQGYRAPKEAGLEGFLFPDTYRLPRRWTAKELITAQLKAFREQVGAIKYRELIIASLVERESAQAQERPLIAGVIYNRLRKGIPLGIDASIRYAVNNWDRPLTQAELDNDSPYNTRLNRGLPPSPIGSPSLASIRAARRPAATRAIYFVADPDRCNFHRFSTNQADFERDVARYKQGGGKCGELRP